MKRITIKDIARDLNLHHSTVSRALRSDPSVNKETRKKILDYAKTHGYQVNMNALHFRSNIKNTIAVLVPNIHHSFFSNVVSVIANLAYPKGYVVSVFQSNESYGHEKEIIKTLIRNNVAGVIASISMETSDSEHFRKLKNYRIPLVLFDRVCHDVNVSKITVNNFDIVAEAVSLLYKKGYRKIAHISGTNKINVFNERQLGYLSAVKKLGIDYSKVLTIDSVFTIEEGRKAAKDLLLDKNRPDAVICDSHFLLLGVMLEAKEFGINGTDEIGLVGFGENPYIDVFNRNVWLIVQPDSEIAHAAFDLIMKKIGNVEDESVENLSFLAKIIER